MVLPKDQVQGLLSLGVVPVKAMVLVDMVGSIGLIWSWLIWLIMDLAESNFFAGDTGDGVLVMGPGKSGFFAGGSLGVTALNISLIKGCIASSTIPIVDGSVTSSFWSGNLSISSCAVGGLQRPLYCSISRCLLPSRSPPCVASIKS